MTSNASDKSLTQVSALRVNSDASRLVKSGSSQKSANDSVSQLQAKNRRGYVTPARVRAVTDQMTDRQLEIIDILEHVHLATGRQIQTMLWGEGRSAARQARRELQVLKDLRVLTRLERRPYGVRGGTLGFVYTLDVIGQAIVGVPSRRRKPHLLQQTMTIRVRPRRRQNECCRRTSGAC
jgi:hypothetical protein